MEALLAAAAFAAAVLFCIIGLMLIPLGLPGTFVIFAGALIYNLIRWSMAISLLQLSLILGLALLGELLEFLLSMKMARDRGASNPAIIGSIVGGIIGAVIGVPVPVVGSLVGLFLGVFLGALGAEFLIRRDFRIALNSAAGAFYGRVGATVAKVIVGMAMIVLIFIGII